MDRPAERGFVGRHAELQALQQALQRAMDGQPGIALLAGEPGIGKTRTAQQMIAHAAQQGVLALWGRCPEEAGAPPYWPWVQLMRRWIALHDEAELARVFAAAAPLASLDPQFAPYLPQPAADLSGSDPAQARFRLFDAVAGFWQRAASRQPLLLVFDDLHRADVPSLKLLEFVMAEAGRSRLLCWAATATPNSVRSIRSARRCCNCSATHRCSGCCSAASARPRRPSSWPRPGCPRRSGAC
jgi:predicted ATPase